MTDRIWVRQDAAFITENGALICLGVGRDPVRFDAESASFARAALGHLRSPQSLRSLRELLERDAGRAIDEAIVVSLGDVLTNAGIVGPAPAVALPSRRPLEGVKIVLGVTGAIASVDAPRTALALQANGATVRVVLTQAALRFVSRSALQAITHAPVPCRLWSSDPSAPVPHIELAQWADAVLVAPASATTLSRLASGDCSDVLSAVVIATRAPVLLAPSMNEQMWRAPATRRNLDVLASDGHAIVEPHVGLEVADEPSQRRARVGSALSPDGLVRALAGWLRSRRSELTDDAIDWDALYQQPEALSWQSSGLDDVVTTMLRAHAPPPARLLDLGCGLGSQAHAAAALGYNVVGIDGSDTALALANAGPDDGALFIKADLLDPGLRSTFDVLLDRGTLHTLRESEIARYAATITRLSHTGSLLVIVHDGPAASATARTLRRSPAELGELLRAFEIVESQPVTLRKGEDGAALCSLYRRRALVSG